MSRQSTSLAGVQPACSHEEVGRALGVSRERVRQIEVAALRKARAVLVRRGVNPAMFFDEWHRSARPG